MEVDEIFATLQSHFIKGLMFHSQLASYFNFLCLEGFARQQQYHYLEENKNYLALNDYFITHYNKLIKDEGVDDPEIIPNSWFSINRKQINVHDITDFIAKAYSKWTNWERDTKELLEISYKELIDSGEMGASLFIAQWVKEIDEELVEAEKDQLLLSSIGYDMVEIVDMQEERKMMFEEKIKKCYK